MFPTLLIGAAVVVGGALLFNALSDGERERQRRLEENHREYRAASDAEYSRIVSNRQRDLENMRRQTAHDLWLERQRAIEERKSRNRKNFDVLMAELQGQIDDRNDLLEQTRRTIDTLKKSRSEDQATALRQNSMQTILNDAYESSARQKAYLRYLERYGKAAKKLFERTGELLEPFQMRLPEFWAYPGKIIGFERDELLGGEFEKSIHPRVDCKFFCEDSDQIDRLFPDDEIIFCLAEDYDDTTYVNKLSCVKGMFLHKLELSPNVRLEGKIKRHKLNERGYVDAYILDADGIEVTLRKKFCRDRRDEPVGKRKFVYVMNYDRKKLNYVNVTERVEDCLSVERFRNVPLLIKSRDVNNFLATVNKRNADNSYDEWYIAPIVEDENFSATRYKCQLGQKLVFQVDFSGDEFPTMCFEKFLPDAEMIGADDIFVALDADLNSVNAERAATLKHGQLQESLNLFVYLNAEFLKQRRIKFNRDNVLFFNQWCAVMRRLVRVKESGGFERVDILEQVDAKRLLTTDDGAARLKNFYVRQAHKHEAEPNFFVRDADGRKIFVTFKDDFKIITAHDFWDDRFLDGVGWRVEVHVREFPYPEIMQLKALEDFRRSQMQRPALKECIFDLSRLPFKDSGRRPTTIKNPSLLRNKNQLTAVVRAIAAENFFMIQGPPGTGKTTVIKEIIWQQLKLAPASKILVVSQANVAVDNVLRGLPAMGIERSAIVRCGNDDKIADELKELSLENRVAEYRATLTKPCRADLQRYRAIWCDMLINAETQGQIGEYLLKNFSVTGATCVGLEKKNFGLDKLSFDLVVADEAGKALPGELLMPINRAKKIIIIGDHKQLPPVTDPAFFDETKLNISDIIDEDSRDRFFATSLFEKLYEACPDDNKCMLNIQFRMPTPIGDMISRLFYGGQLACAPNCDKKFPMFFGSNILFLNMDGDDTYREQQDDLTGGKKSSPYNEREIQVAVDLLKRLREKFSGRIAVITPYKRQNKKLHWRLRAERLANIAVNTIDAFQGDEADVVIYCTTRAHTPTKYFSDAARLNVAFSRARNLLIIIGSLKYFRRYKAGHLMQTVADNLERCAKVVGYAEFFAAEFPLNFREPPQEISGDDLTETPFTRAQDYLPAQDCDNRLTCAGCGKKFDADELTEGFCPECLFDGEHYKCSHCGADMLYTNAARYVYRQPREELCAECKIIWRHTCKRCRKNEVIVRARDVAHTQKTEDDFPYCADCLKARREKIFMTCAACGQKFFVTQGQVDDLHSQGKEPSKYCRDCWEREESVGRCKRCKRSITFKRAVLHELRSQGKKISEYCRDCANYRNEKIFMTCAACGQSFSVNRGFVEDLSAQGKVYYCDECRKENVCLPQPCKVCGRPIYISRAELHRLRERFGSDYAPPRKHKTCK